MTGRSFALTRWLPVLAMAAAAGGSPAAVADQPIAEYDRASGCPRRLAFDITRNGRNDTVGLMDGTRVDRIELDLDKDGHVDRWDGRGVRMEPYPSTGSAGQSDPGGR